MKAGREDTRVEQRTSKETQPVISSTLELNVCSK